MLLDHHRAKIVPISQLSGLVGVRPRGQKVVLCCGVFDVVHPGHLRHLAYARSKADVLVCGVTSDQYVGKGPHRPHVPQELRAANLSMLDIIDYVVVVDDENPLGLILSLQPEYYAKGFEYSEHKRGRPIAEVAAVESYGGTVLFTPGDVVYSSSALIESAAPDLRWEKLALLLRARGITFDILRQALVALSAQSVHVVGDTIVDALLHCDMIGANAKTPTISVRRGEREQFAGGAAVVAKHARAAGAEVTFTTVFGDDNAGLFAMDDLKAAGVDVYPVVDRARPTTIKEAVVVEGYRLLKIDTVDNRPVSGGVLRRLVEQVGETHKKTAAVFSDFRHGVFHAHSIRELVAAIPEGCLRAADSQVASRWGNVCDFQDFDLLTPNEREARFALGDQDSGVRPLAARLREVAKCRWLLMKMGLRGMLAFGEDGADCFTLDSHAGRVLDPVGAGDAFLAYAVLSLLARPGDLATAAVLGTFAAGAECEYDGNVPVAPERVLAKIDEAEKELR